MKKVLVFVLSLLIITISSCRVIHTGNGVKVKGVPPGLIKKGGIPPGQQKKKKH